MHVEFELSWWAVKNFWRRKWRRTLIRLHLRKPYDGPPVMQLFGTLKFSNERLHAKLHDLPPVPFVDSFDVDSFDVDLGPIKLTNNPYETPPPYQVPDVLRDPEEPVHFLRQLADLDEKLAREEEAKRRENPQR